MHLRNFHVGLLLFALGCALTTAQRGPDTTPVEGVYQASRRGTIGTTVATNENAGLIYGPFEAGFGAGRVCANSPELPGGLDTRTAVDLARFHCPELEENPLFNSCGGHANPFHYHERFTCLYTDSPNGHSTRVADIPHHDLGEQGLYGKYETARQLPREAGNPLDACNGHFGITPDSNGQVVYHYHVTDHAPFSVGCLGPAVGDKLVTVAQCRAASDHCDDGDVTSYEIRPFGAEPATIQYDPDCSCWDAKGSNTLPITELDLSVSSTAASTAQPATTTSADSGSRPKNVLLFMPDDLPFMWPEAPEYPADLERRSQDWSAVTSAMPAFQRVRDEGAIFSHAHTVAPKCAPARYGLMTGRYPSRGIYAQNRASAGQLRTNVQVPTTKLTGADLSRTVAAELSQTGAFTTAQSGKWHIGSSGDWNDYSTSAKDVSDAGFDVAAAVYHSNMDDVNLGFSHNNEWVVAETLDAIESAVDTQTPFYAYIAPTSPHGPSNEDALSFSIRSTPNGTIAEDPISGMPPRSDLLTRAEAVIAQLPTRPNRRDSVIGALGVDDALGAVLASLESWSVLEDTLVIVLMDHGMIAKDSLYEGGSRVALMMRHPKTIAAKSTVAYPVSTIDIAPTILDAVGLYAGRSVDAYDLDGLSLWSTVAGDQSKSGTLDRYCIITEIDFSRAALCGGVFKFISNGDGGDASRVGYPASAEAEQLYNLDSDSTEQTNLIADQELHGLISALRSLVECHDAHTRPGSLSADCNMGALDNAVAAAVESGTGAPTMAPTIAPTGNPTEAPTQGPTSSPTNPPSGSPSPNPTITTQKPSTTSTAVPCVRRCGMGDGRKGAKRGGRSVNIRGVTVDLP